jgi:hypothetical protein
MSQVRLFNHWILTSQEIYYARFCLFGHHDRFLCCRVWNDTRPSQTLGDTYVYRYPVRNCNRRAAFLLIGRIIETREILGVHHDF